MTTTTDAQLVSAYLSGDRTALATIYDRYAPGLYDTARAMLSDRHDASDMVQDVFVIAAERLDQLREPDRLKPWLYAVLRNEVYRRTKKRKRAVPTDFQSETVPDVPASYDPRQAGEAVAYEELASMVRSASAGLDERDRLVLELSVRQGLSGSDLADALGVTAEQSYSLVHRMRERVEKSLGAYAVAKAGRRDCPDLDRMLAAWDGEFTVLIRKRVNRHIEECATCDRSRKTLAPLALFGAAPAFVLPFGLRDRVLAATANVGPVTDSGSGPTDSTSTSGSTSESTSESTSTSSGSSSRLRFDARTGFPRAARLGRRALFALVGSSIAVLAVVGGVLVAQSNNEEPAGDSTEATSIAPSDITGDTALDSSDGDTVDSTVAGVVSPMVPAPPAAGNGGGSGNSGAGGPPAAPTETNTPLAPAGSPATTTSVPTTTTAPANALSPAPTPVTTVPMKTTTTLPPKTTTTTSPSKSTTTTTTPPKTTTTTAAPKTTTTTAAPQRTLTLGKVAGTFPSCSTLGVQGVVTTTETGIQVFGEVEFFNVDKKTLGVRPVKLALASASTWRGTVTDTPTGAVTAQIRLTARSTSGLTSTGTGSATQVNKC